MGQESKYKHQQTLVESEAWMEPSKYLTEAELAKILKVSKSTLYKLREDGSLPFQMIGTCIRYAKPDVEKWLESNRFNVHEKEQL
jgi:excisionase family DNA binding protein